jgi:hypothetical protein
LHSDALPGFFYFITMEKEGFYFPHFCNARHDRKIKRLRKELGVEGYGIYFMLLETLRDQHDLRYPLEDVDLLAEEFNVSEQKVRVTICNYQLFEIDDEQKFFSPKMLLYLEPYYRMKEQRREAGLKSAAKRKLNESSTTVQRPLDDRSTKERKEKESKVKESKVKEIKEKESKEENAPKGDFTFRDILLNKWFTYKKEKKSTYTLIGQLQLEKQWQDKTDQELEEAINHSISNNYQGLFPPKKTVELTEKKGKFQTNLENISQAAQNILDSHDNGTYQNPFDRF